MLLRLRQCIHDCRSSVLSEVQTWGNLPAKKRRDIPAVLLPLLARCVRLQKRARVLTKQLSKKASFKETDPDGGTALAMFNQAVTGVKYVLALVGYFCVPNDTLRSKVLATGSETRYISIAQLLVEVMENSSENSCAAVAQHLMDWAVDLTVSTQHSAGRRSRKNSKSTTEEPESLQALHLQMNALTLQEALISARCGPATLCVPSCCVTLMLRTVQLGHTTANLQW